jgi:hypothetical protein
MTDLALDAISSAVIVCGLADSMTRNHTKAAAFGFSVRAFGGIDLCC